MAKVGKRTVDALLLEATGSVLRDEELKGFQARRTGSGVTYAFEYRAGAGRAAPVRRLTIGQHGKLTPDEARKLAKDAALAVASGDDPAANKSKAKGVPTFAAFAGEHLDDMAAIAERHPEKAILRPGSIANYRSLLKVHVGPAIGAKQLHAVGKDDIKRLHVSVGKERPATANRCLEFVGSMYRAAAEARHVDEGTNPARGIKAFKESRRERFLAADELARLGEAIRKAEGEGIEYVPPVREGKKLKHVPKNLPPQRIDTFSAAALRLLVFSGARLREILHAKWSDLDADHATLAVFGKTGQRYIHLPPPAMEVISRLERAGDYIIASTDPKKPKADLARPWRTIQKAARLEGVRIHDLRHSFASVAVSGGASLPMIGHLLGHTQAQTTARYAHLAADPVKAAAEKTAATIEAAMAGAASNVIRIRRAQ